MVKVLEEWVTAIEGLGPYRTHPDGRLFLYADPEKADEGEPSGIFVEAEQAVRRALAGFFGPEDWTTNKRNEVIGFLKDANAPVFSEIDAPLIPVLNGVLDLSEPDVPAFERHSSLYGFTAQIPHLYNPNATCPRIEAFLYEACGGDADMVQFIYEVIGYSLLPFQFLRKAVMVTGPSGTGKSTVLWLIERLVGQGNAAYVPLQSLGEDKFATSDLFGKLVNIGGDIDSTEIRQTGMFKSLTGDDFVRADVKFGKPIRFRSGATCWFAANEIPASRDHSDAWRGRWIIMPFDTKPTKPDFLLKNKLSGEDEMEGLLRHAVEGAATLLIRGRLSEPEPVRNAHARFVRETDQVQGFLDHAEAKFHGSMQPTQLWAAYTAWAAEEGRRSVRRAVIFQRAAERWSTNNSGAYQIPKPTKEDA